LNYTYMLECSDGSYYTGWTNDLEKRINMHNSGRGGKYTRSRNPVTLVYFEEFSTKEEAQIREYEIKKLTRKEKEELIKEGNRLLQDKRT
jgi:putative endonuclease